MAQSLIPQSGWSVVYADSQETVKQNGAAVNAIDGNPATMWVTQWYPTSVPLPHEIQINLGGWYTLSAFQYLARQDGCANGWINQYAFYVSADGVNWGSPVASGTFNYGNLSTACPGGGVPAAIQVNFPPVTGQYIRLQALSEINGNPWTAVAEIDVLGIPASEQSTLASVSLNPTVVAGGSSSTGTVTLNGPAPAGGAMVTLSSGNASVAVVPASVTVSAGSNTATFPVTTALVASSTQATISGNYIANQSATLMLNPVAVPQSGWSVIYADSQELVCENGAAINAIDGNPNTKWVTQWCPSSAPLPHEIQINLGGWYTLSAFQYLARQDGCANGWIKDFEFYMSSDGVNWGSPVTSGTFSYGSLSTRCPGAGVPPALQVEFQPVMGQYIRLRALSEINGNPWTAVAEIDVLGAPGTPPTLLTVGLSPASLAGGSPSTGTVTLSGPAPAEGATVALSSNSPATVLVPASVTIPEGATAAVFPVATALVTNSTTVTITGSYNGNQTGTLTLNPSPIPQLGWSVIYADSQETVCQNGAATNAIDGNPNTMWVTQWCPSSTPVPHEIQINLGAPYPLGAFQYLARQDGCGNGWINQYEFYVSTDGVNWGTPVATGAFNYGGLSTACPGGGVPPPLQVNFTPVTAQYIRLRALSEINGHPWTAVAEIDVLGDLQPVLSLSASGLNFPYQLLNTSNAQTVTLTNVGFSAVGLTSMATSGDFSQANNCGSSLPVLSSCTITVTFTPQAPGYRSGLLTVQNNATGQLNIPLSGVGVTMHTISLSWTPSTAPVSGYVVYRAPQSGGFFTALNAVPQSQTTFTDSLPGGSTYFYVVTAVGTNQVESLPSNEIEVTTPAD